ncbi:hypothetical protein [Micromonospora peucetia]|uniref:Polymorphic outer membrane protein repeat-containing protein n=1 Tax=Micromonospora peucetia TaxID=47871 RepID=A0A1C6VS95_9ACTN|nr:hypothetical protein [Micromonospora peucetia]SCL69206.1 hypothetical protein GA0070608_3941 [Micromonospora peucetia]
MSTKQFEESGTERPAARRRKRPVLWVATGVAGLTGAVGLAASGVVTLPGVSAAGSLDRLSDRHLTEAAAQAKTPLGADDQVGAVAGAGTNVGGPDPGADGKGDKKGLDDKKQDVTDVPCATDKLIVALNRVNADHGGTLKLAQGCTYLLTLNRNGNGLPEIVRPITIQGEGATILRATNAAAFRIFSVGAGGDLTLHDLTVKGGFAQTNLGGGGLLVQAGGRATIHDSRITGNQSSSVGGGITNFGATRILTTAGTSAENDGQNKGPLGLADDDRAAGGPDDADGIDGAAPDGAVETHPGTDAGTAAPTAPDTDTQAPIGTAAPTAPDTDTQAPIGTAAPTAPDTDTQVPADTAAPTVPDGGTAGAAGSGGPVAQDASKPGQDKGGNGESEDAREGEVTYNTAVSSGGGIYNIGQLAVEDSRVSHNQSGDTGGGLENAGSAVVTNTWIAHNDAEGSGGGVQSGGNPNVVMTIKQSEVFDNSSGESGGGIRNVGTMYVQDSTVRDNTANSDGGGIANLAATFSGLSVSNSKVNDNVARGNGGGISNDSGQVVVFNSEVDRNRVAADQRVAGGIYNQGGTISLIKSRITQNSSLLGPGGVSSDNNRVTVDNETVIIENKPTNCEGRPAPNCFG